MDVSNEYSRGVEILFVFLSSAEHDSLISSPAKGSALLKNE